MHNEIPREAVWAIWGWSLLTSYLAISKLVSEDADGIQKLSSLGLLAMALGVLWWYYRATAPEREARRAQHEAQAREEAEERAKERERIAHEKEERKRSDYERRVHLRAEIEKMPKYQNWRSAVFEKCGRKCEICGSTSELEIHHRVSFDAILRHYNIQTQIEAFECNALWSVANGSVLCKACHSKMRSSKIREALR
jgi:hypothetical protein